MENYEIFKGAIMLRHSIRLGCLVIISVFSLKSFAWGERGHHVICEVSTRLVESEELADFLQGR